MPPRPRPYARRAHGSAATVDAAGRRAASDRPRRATRARRRGRGDRAAPAVEPGAMRERCSPPRARTAATVTRFARRSQRRSGGVADAFHQLGPQCIRPATGASPPVRRRRRMSCARSTRASRRACSRRMVQATLGCAAGAARRLRRRISRAAHGKRPIPDTFGVALVLLGEPRRSNASRGIDADIDTEPADTLADPRLEALRTAIPAARALPLLRSLAARVAGRVSLDYLDDTRLTVKLTPCD